MCNLNKIGGFIAAASAAVLLSTVLCAIAAINANGFYSALANSVVVGAAAVAIGLALLSINGAITNVGTCTFGPCKGSGETLMNALITLSTALTVLLAALILGIVGAAIPWAGTAVAIGLGVGAAAIAITLIVVANNLRTLETCLGSPPSVGVGVATALIGITVIAVVILTAGAAAGW